MRRFINIALTVVLAALVAFAVYLAVAPVGGPTVASVQRSMNSFCPSHHAVVTAERDGTGPASIYGKCAP